MIEKMKFLSITGPKKDIDRVIDRYLSKHEIHLENALSELKTVKDLRPYIEINPYRESYQRAGELMELVPSPEHGTGNKKSGNKKSASHHAFAGSHHLTPHTAPTVTLEEAMGTVEQLDVKVRGFSDEETALLDEQSLLQESLDKVIPFTGLNYDLRSILHFRYVKFRFGRITHEYFDKFESYVYDTIDTVLYKCREDSQYVWMVYFVPETISDQIDAIYASMHFERYYLPDEYEGTPLDAIHYLEDKISSLQEKLDSVKSQMTETLREQEQSLRAAYEKLATFSTNFNVRKLAACTKHKVNTFYILCGWMSEGDAAVFQKAVSEDEMTFCIVEDDHNNVLSKPPTKLHNLKLFRPFEMFIGMYGLPAYGEIDPTILIALTYSFLFGFMFGDVGQGLCLLLGGFLLYRLKKADLAAILSCCGFFSTLFGFLFGSVFGFENIISAVWLRPMEHMTNLPFIGKLNTVFVVAISIGMGIILLTMVLNIINSIREHDKEKAFLDTNGAAGLVFYGSMVLTIVLYMTGNPLPATILLILMFGIPLVLIFFKEPLTGLVEKKARVMTTGKGMFVVQGIFELFEVLLSYFSNTLSFVRVGAFAISHAAMMQVVLMLSGAEAGNPNWVVIILGNVAVCAIEGLVVGIQVLRLEYYELFSRFYRGNGRAFKPYGKTN